MKMKRKMGRRSIALFLVLMLCMNSLTAFASEPDTDRVQTEGTEVSEETAQTEEEKVSEPVAEEIEPVEKQEEAQEEKPASEEKAAQEEVPAPEEKETTEQPSEETLDSQGGNAAAETVPEKDSQDNGTESSEADTKARVSRKTMAKARSTSSGYITINVRVYDTSTWTTYDVGTDRVSIGDPELIQSANYQIPQLSYFVDSNRFGKVSKVVGNWYFPGHDTQPGANVEWSTNAGTKTMTYWVNWYMTGSGAGDKPDSDNTGETVGGGSKAPWTKKIIYHSNYPDGTDYTVSVTYTIKPYTSTGDANGNLKTFEATGFSVPDGYKTKGRVWNTKKDGSGSDYASGGNYYFKKSDRSDLHLYAQYDPDGAVKVENVKLTYKDGNAVIGERTYSKGEEVTVINQNKEGYTFKGWSETDGGVVKYKAGETFLIDEDTVLYAVWEENQDDTYTVIYKDSAEYGGTVFATHTGLKEGAQTPGYYESWFAGKDKDFYAWSPSWEKTVGGTNHTIVYTATYKAKEQYQLTIYYQWAGSSEAAAPDYKDILYRDDSYNVKSPAVEVPFEYVVSPSTIEGTVGGSTHDIKYWVIYTPKVKIQHIYRVNGEVVGEVFDETMKTVPFGGTLTENSYGITKRTSYDGKYYTYTSADTVTLPDSLSQLTEQPVLKLYYDRTEKETHNVIVHYKWAGTDVTAAEDQVVPWEEGKFYLVQSPAGVKTAPFSNIITENAKLTLSGIMGKKDIEETVYYAPQYTMKYILQENGETKYFGNYQGIWTGAFGKSYTLENYIGQSFNPNDATWGQYYCTKVENAVFPANPADLKETPAIVLYFNKTIPTTLTVTKTAGRSEVKAGETVNYTIKVENTGTVIAKDVKVTDVLPKELEFVSASITPDGDGYIIGDIPAGETRELTITAKVSENVSAGTEITNTASADYMNKPEDTPNPSGEAKVTVTEEEPEKPVSATLKVTKEADKKEVKAGEQVEYTITVQNTGDVTAKDVKVTDSLPEGLKFISASITPEGNVYAIGDIPAGESRTLTITAEVSEAAVPGTEIKNTAAASYTNKPEGEPDPSGEVNVTVTEEEPEKPVSTTLKVTKEADKKEVKAGEQVEYTITVQNTGDVTAKDVKVTDSLPEGLKFISASITPDGNVYAIGDIPAGESRTLTITAEVSETAVPGTEIKNTAAASYTNKPEGEPDPSGEVNVIVTEEPTPGPGTEEPTPGPGTEEPTPGPGTEEPTPGPGTEEPTPGPGTEEPTPGPGTDDPTPNPGNGNPGVTPVVPTPAPAPQTPTPTPAVPAAFAPFVPAAAPAAPAAPVVPAEDEDVPLAANPETNEETLTEAEDEAVPLAAGPHDHKCCILHFLIMALALLVEALYTKSMKKHQKKIFDTRRELADLEIRNRSAA